MKETLIAFVGVALLAYLIVQPFLVALKPLLVVFGTFAR